MVKKELLFNGSEKQVYATDDPGMVLSHFKDVATAFKKVKTAVFPNKGVLSNKISAIVFKYLEDNGIYTHFVEEATEREQLCRKSEVIPLEVVVRNYIAGSLADRLAIDEGTKANSLIIDINYKNSQLGDPFINDTHAVALGIVNQEDLSFLYETARKINTLLMDFFGKAGIKLIDFKLEFGRDAEGRIMVCDEISPNTSRLWDAETDSRLDKDRFRHDLSYVVASYEEVLSRLSAINQN